MPVTVGGVWAAMLYTLCAIVCFMLIIKMRSGFAALRTPTFCLWPSAGLLAARTRERLGGTGSADARQRTA
jgi:uncharacterized membrane protein YccF (DUF307 family)